MGISTEATMMIGADYPDLVSKLIIPKEFEDDTVEYLNTLGLSCSSPWYDSEPEHWFIGFNIDNVNLNAKDWIKWNKDIQISYDRLRSIVGPDLKIELRGVVNVY